LADFFAGFAVDFVFALLALLGGLLVERAVFAARFVAFALLALFAAGLLIFAAGFFAASLLVFAAGFFAAAFFTAGLLATG
jgi:hypothetical protein